MRYLLFFLLSNIWILKVNSQLAYVEKPPVSLSYLSSIENNNEATEIRFQDEPGRGKMRAIEFKNQEFCRAEVENFDFDVHFSIVSATVYFSGTNFKNVEKGTITSSSLKPISRLMARCSPGSIVVFDDVKVIGPDNKQRTIQSLSLLLY